MGMNICLCHFRDRLPGGRVGDALPQLAPVFADLCHSCFGFRDWSILHARESTISSSGTYNFCENLCLIVNYTLFFLFS